LCLKTADSNVDFPEPVGPKTKTIPDFDTVSKPLVDTELNAYLNDIYISSATAILSQSKDLDFSYSIKISR
jgi:hypothetical protein